MSGGSKAEQEKHKPTAENDTNYLSLRMVVIPFMRGKGRLENLYSSPYINTLIFFTVKGDPTDVMTIH